MYVTYIYIYMIMYVYIYIYIYLFLVTKLTSCRVFGPHFGVFRATKG